MPNQNTKGMGVSFVILEKIQDDLKDHESLVPIRVSLYRGMKVEKYGGGGSISAHLCVENFWPNHAHFCLTSPFGWTV